MKITFEFARDKVQAGMVAKWGVISPLQNSDILARTQATNIERYGVHSPMMCDEVKEKTKQSNSKKYGHIYASRSHYSALAYLVAHWFIDSHPYGEDVVTDSEISPELIKL